MQELLAPRYLYFFDQNWRYIGNIHQLCEIISEVTGIRDIYLTDRSRHTDASVAMKMSWASKRQTSRTEDAAYCLLGLFDVNMPLLYGEGQKAFVRVRVFEPIFALSKHVL